MWEGMQGSFKVLINSFYGYLGYSGGLFNDYDAAERVTLAGQRIVKQVVTNLLHHGATPIEVDTDGVYFVLLEGVLETGLLLPTIAYYLGIRDKLFVATKVWTSGREAGIRQMEQSIRLMRTNRMDLMQIHNLLDVETPADAVRQQGDRLRHHVHRKRRR
mgnify:CR=1 FL=1